MYEYCRVLLHLVCSLKTVNNQWKDIIVCCTSFGFGDPNPNCGTVSSVTTLSCDWSLVVRKKIYVQFRFVELQSQGRMRFECMVLSSGNMFLI